MGLLCIPFKLTEIQLGAPAWAAAPPARRGPRSAVAASPRTPGHGRKGRVPTHWALTAQSACGRQPGDPGPGEEAPAGFQFSRAHVTSAARLLVLGVAVSPSSCESVLILRTQGCFLKVCCDARAPLMSMSAVPSEDRGRAAPRTLAPPDGNAAAGRGRPLAAPCPWCREVTP